MTEYDVTTMSDVSNPDQQVDAQTVVNDLLEQIKRLTYDNALLRAQVTKLVTAQMVADPKSD